MKKLAIHISKRTLQLGILFIFLLAVYVVAGRMLLPMLQDYRAVVERDLSELLGVGVSIEEIEGSFRGFNPALIARHVDVFNGTDEPGFRSSIHLESLTVELDFFQTLTHGEFVFRELFISGLEFYAHQTSTGKWQLTGWESPPDNNQPSIATGPVVSRGDDLATLLGGFLTLVERQDHIRIMDMIVHLQPYQEQPRTLDRLQMDLYDLVGGSIQLDISARVGFQQTVQAVAVIGGEFDSFKNVTVDAYLQSSMLDVVPWLTVVPSLDSPLAALTVKPELWLNWDGEQWQLNGSADVGNIQFLAEGQLHQLSDLNIDLALRYSNAEQWQLWLDNIKFAMAGYQWPSSQVYAEGRAGGVIEVATPGFDVALVKNMLLRDDGLSGLPKELLTTLNPEGRLENIRFRYLPNQDDFEVSAHLKDVSVDAWQQAPSGRGVNGLVHASKLSGYVKLDSDDFTLGLNKLFRESWNYRDASGFLHWQIADNQYSLITENLLLVGDEGEIHGQFKLDIPFDDRPVTMGLQAGIRNGDVRYAGKYIPVGDGGLGQDVVTWLDRGLLAGKIKEGAFIMNGALQDTDSINDFTVGLFFDVNQADIHYLDDWPAAEKVSALVVINDDEVRVDATEGEVWSAQIKTLSVSIPSSPGDAVPILSVKGQAHSDSVTAMRLLRDSPIDEILGGEAHDWEIAGDLGVGLDLSVALGEGEDRYQVNVALDDNAFLLKSEQLQLENINGELHYDTDRGLYSEPIDLSLLGSPAEMRAVADGDPNQLVKFEVVGALELTNLYAWLEQIMGGANSALTLASELTEGQTDYKATLIVSEQSGGSAVVLDIDAPLKDVAVKLPQPLGKPQQLSRPMHLRVATDPKNADQITYSGNYFDLLDWEVLFKKEGLYGANLALGGLPPQGPVKQEFGVQGRIVDLTLKTWVDWATQTFDAGSGEGAAYRVVIDDLEIEQLDAYGQPFSALSVSGEISDKQHRLQLTSPGIEGTLIQDVDTSHYQINLQRLHLAALSDDPTQQEIVDDSESTTASEPEFEPEPAAEFEQDPWQDLDPRQFPGMNIDIADLRFGDNPWGSIAANLRPYDEGFHLFNVHGKIREVDIQGDLSWAYSNGIHHTYSKGELSVGNMGDVLVSWGFPRSVETKSGSFKYDLRWLGSPAAVSEKSLQGSLDGELLDGQFVDTGQSTGALRILGILNINNISRRLKLDFSDLFSSGISFDRTRIPLSFDKGVVKTDSKMVIDGTGSDFSISGTMNLNERTVDTELIVTLPLTSTLPILGLVLVNPVFGGAMLVFDQLLGDEIQQFASVKYTVKGDADNPEVKMDRLFGRH